MPQGLVISKYTRTNEIIPNIPKRLEHVKTTYEAIKKVALKLADMSEEEMDNYIKEHIKDGTPKKSFAEQFQYDVKKNTRTGEDMHVVSKNNGVVISEDENNSARNSAKTNEAIGDIHSVRFFSNSCFILNSSEFGSAISAL